VAVGDDPRDDALGSRRRGAGIARVDRLHAHRVPGGTGASPVAGVDAGVALASSAVSISSVPWSRVPGV
jgi:hypothetical protein